MLVFWRTNNQLKWSIKSINWISQQSENQKKSIKKSNYLFLSKFHILRIHQLKRKECSYTKLNSKLSTFNTIHYHLPVKWHWILNNIIFTSAYTSSSHFNKVYSSGVRIHWYITTIRPCAVLGFYYFLNVAGRIGGSRSQVSRLST